MGYGRRTYLGWVGTVSDEIDAVITANTYGSSTFGRGVIPVHVVREKVLPLYRVRARRGAFEDVAEVIDEERAKWMAGSKQHVALTRLRDRIIGDGGPVEGGSSE
jgi:hypothetical protein